MAVRHHIKVLVIDDDPSVCKTVGLLLEDHGYRPRTFTDPQKALESADEESCQIALVDLYAGGNAALAYGLSLAPSGALALFMRKERARIVDNVKVFFLFVFRKDLRQMLEEKRTEVERELARLTKLANRPPEVA